MEYSVLRQDNGLWSEQKGLTRDEALAIFRPIHGIVRAHLHKNGVCVDMYREEVMQCQFQQER